MSLCIVFVRAYNLYSKNKSNDKERKKESEREKINSIYKSDKQRYLKF